MNAKYATVHYGTKRKVVKDLTAPAPYIRRTIFPLTFVVKPVDLGDLPTLVVAADERNTVRVAYFQGEQ